MPTTINRESKRLPAGHVDSLENGFQHSPQTGLSRLKLIADTHFQLGNNFKYLIHLAKYKILKIASYADFNIVNTLLKEISEKHASSPFAVAPLDPKKFQQM